MAKQYWLFCRLSSRRSRCLLALPFTPLAGYGADLRSSFPGLAYRLLRLSALECLHILADCMTDYVLCGLLRHSQNESLHPQSRFPDLPQISRAKFDRHRRATAGFTTRALDG